MKEWVNEAEARAAVEEKLVNALGALIGYGRMMQLAEQIWRRVGEVPGSEHTVGPCALFLVPCRHVGYLPGNCDWCCGAGRVTKRVDQAMGN